MSRRGVASIWSSPYLLLALFFAASAAVRPLLPTAETRYLSVAWEMFLTRDFLVPTLNFAPYYHKPPLLFWLFDAAWAVFGVHRVVAVGVMFLIASACVWLTTRLARMMFPDTEGIAERVPWLMVGSVVFAIYASLIYIDLLQTVFVLTFMIALLAFANGGARRHALLAGLSIGLGILAKGPVMLIHVIWPILLYPWWRNPQCTLPVRAFYRGCVPLALAALVPVLAWLGPVMLLADQDFLYNLVWKQAAERISGAMEGAHPRPFYFYLIYLPLLFVPWIFSPHLYRQKGWELIWSRERAEDADFRMLRLLALWFLGALVSFSLISGKQPHYLVPELPLVVIAFGYFMSTVSLRPIRNAAIAMLALFVVGQEIAAAAIHGRFDMMPLVQFVRSHRQAEWVFAGQYQGQINFLARLDKPLEIIPVEKAEEWLRAHPNGYLLEETKQPVEAIPAVLFSHAGEKGAYVVRGGATAEQTHRHAVLFPSHWRPI
ncbi:ArnT family glycosyltransferase [Arvimicrobium flavum]|uniref:ArnT family glycosyltransferase n=1 Tax=Arvimicrobium flavum TaxID=3393320 RepID=UPI00237ADDC2|nr:glycosyltransferase family 39 protein [Mesorhizobium shangrilense]